MNPHEQAFVEAFVQLPRRDRALFCLSKPKKRREFIDKFAHHGRDILIPQYLKSIEPSHQNPKSICAIPRSLHRIGLLEARNRIAGLVPEWQYEIGTFSGQCPMRREPPSLTPRLR
jgi:hypothetical protein